MDVLENIGTPSSNFLDCNSENLARIFFSLPAYLEKNLFFSDTFILKDRSWIKKVNKMTPFSHSGPS